MLGMSVFDQLTAQSMRGGTAECAVSIRLTTLLALDNDWRIAAAYWSVPFGTQADQDAVKRLGRLQPGRVLDEAVTDDAAHLVRALRSAIDEPRLLPDLYSTSDNQVTIGSVADEVFVGETGKAAWAEFVQYVTAFVPRGPMRAALAAPDIGWLAANIEVGHPSTPYRFFYVWTRESTGWRIVVSHDAVSRIPSTRTRGSVAPTEHR